MPAATVLPPCQRRLTKVNAIILAVVLGGGGLAAVGAAEMAGAAPTKKPCAGKSCKAVTSGSTTASPTQTATSEPAPAPSPASESPTAEPTSEPAVEPAPTPEPTQEATAEPAPSPSSDPSGTWVSPEGVTITVDPAVSGWTPKKVYDVLQPNAYQLALIGPMLKIVVSNDPGSMTTTGASSSGGVYTSFGAKVALSAAESSSLNTNPDRLVAHEYGHVWTLYHLYMSQAKDWSTYLAYRGLDKDSRLDSSYLWDRKELIADDYRILFGTTAAVSGASYINREVTDPRQVPGLKDFFVKQWARGQCTVTC